MKNLKILLNKYILNNIEKISPRLYKFLLYQPYRAYLKCYNFLKYKDKYFFSTITIETNTYCNRKCLYCPNTNFETPKNFMSDEVFFKAISELKTIKYNGIITYSFYNEPLFDNRLENFVEHVKKEIPQSVQVVFTNGDILDIARGKSLIKSGVDKFIVTVHDDNPEKGLERLKIVKAVLKEKMSLQSSIDLELANRGGSVDVSKYSNAKKEIKKCPSILGPVVGINGDIMLCCHDYHRKHVMGNIMEQSITDIWKSYSNLRYDLLENNKVELDICKKCLNIKA